MAFNFDAINETQFEEFCYDTLASLDFTNLSWRKGTGLSSSPSDQGRDIQAVLNRKDIDNSLHQETWFVECKHYKKGVPPDKLQGTLAWAQAARPDVLLIIVSNYLSNPCKQYLDDYQKNYNPPFRIKVWELKDLENITAGNERLRRKYGLSTEIAFLDNVNKYHLIYALKGHFNTIKYFIALMDSLNPVIRDNVFYATYLEQLKPRMREPVSGDETVSDLYLDPIDYASFRKLMLSIEEGTPRFVHQIVTTELGMFFYICDKTSLPAFEDQHKRALEYLESQLADVTHEKEKALLEEMHNETQKRLIELPTEIEKRYADYEYICNELVQKLLQEQIIFSNPF